MTNFTKQRAAEALDALMDLGTRLSKPKLREFFGHINQIAIFIEAAKVHAPENDLEVHVADS